ncbi:MAG TPA: phosphatidylglycerol lysyltransferase domain-containing protein [Solirubrobacteraceae bacterium]|nr:phosphatidylglycerol lysyltransferase domain-containing protein [Solirubrobacteraceae bacterium]
MQASPQAVLRPRRRGDWLPPLAAALTLLAAAVNIASALTPELPGRMRVLLALAPAHAVVVAHALVLPAGLGLLLVGMHLARRRRRALHVAVALLALIGALELAKGLDVEEALLSWGLACLLVWGRGAFCVRQAPVSLARALGRALLIAGGALALGTLAVLAAAPHDGGRAALRGAAQLLTLTGPRRMEWLPVGLGLLGFAALAAATAELFRPLRARHAGAAAPSRRRAVELVQAHGADTLSSFKLRGDVEHLFSPDGRAFLAYRITGGVLLVSGDPVGPADAIPPLLRRLCAFGEEHGLPIAVVGASEALSAQAKPMRLRSAYLGDEAIVETASFSLDGRRIKKVRQACHRIGKAGYSAELRTLGELDDAALAEIEAVSELWRDGAPERGFSMALDTLRAPHLHDSTIVLARDGDGAIRGFLHFVQVYGRPALSLSLMRRDRETPNGLIDFLVVQAVLLARERGIEELSLNFAAFARYLRAPEHLWEHALGRIVGLLDRFFQVESLYRFNAKFHPRWEPRYVLFQGAPALPRTAIAALHAEGQLPLPPALTRFVLPEAA